MVYIKLAGGKKIQSKGRKKKKTRLKWDLHARDTIFCTVDQEGHVVGANMTESTPRCSCLRVSWMRNSHTHGQVVFYQRREFIESCWRRFVLRASLDVDLRRRQQQSRTSHQLGKSWFLVSDSLTQFELEVKAAISRFYSQFVSTSNLTSTSRQGPVFPLLPAVASI